MDPTYCPVCSHKLTHAEIGGRDRPVCDNCGYVHFVNPVPGVGVLIEKDGGLVLVRRGHPPHKDEWTLPSGFVEADESAEEATVREAEEETGLKVEIVELAAVNSFPEGPPTSGIMIFFRARPIGGELQAGDDADDVRVFAPDDLPLISFRTHREMVSEWVMRQQHPVDAVVNANLVTERDFIIRPADITDMKEIGALMQLIPANRALPRGEWENIAQRFREVPGLEVFVAQTRQQPATIIGFITLPVPRSLTVGIGIINDMAVRPTFQRRGVGAALLEAVMIRGRHRNLSTLLVNASRANDQARAFYAASGFDEAATMRIKLSGVS